MATTIAVQITPQGVLIPRAAVQEWIELEESGLLVKPHWEPVTPPVSPEERAELAKKLSVGRPLSEVVIEEREERW